MKPSVCQRGRWIASANTPETQYGERDEFDLVAVGRALLVDPAWPRKVQEARYDELVPFEPAALATLP